MKDFAGYSRRFPEFFGSNGMLSGICCYRLPRRYAPRNDNAGDPLAARDAGEWAISVRRGGESAEVKATVYATQGNGLGNLRREHESRQLPFSPELRMAAREEGFTEYFVNLVV